MSLYRYVKLLACVCWCACFGYWRVRWCDVLARVRVHAVLRYTLFNLGRCFEGAGYTKEAVSTYLQLVAIARKELAELDALDVDDFRVDGACAAHAFRTSSAPLLEAPFGGPFWESLGGDPWGSFLGESPHAAAEHAAPLEHAHADYNCVCGKKGAALFEIFS